MSIARNPQKCEISPLKKKGKPFSEEYKGSFSNNINENELFYNSWMREELYDQ